MKRTPRWPGFVLLGLSTGCQNLQPAALPVASGEIGTARAAAFASAKAPAIQPVAYQQLPPQTAFATYHTAAEARLDLVQTAYGTEATGACPPGIGCPAGPGCPPGAGAAAGGGLVGFASPRYDEFLCDGGDRNPPVHYGNNTRDGLDTEDTVAEWSDPAGGRHVTPSNKVCVYAPRFGEVRSFSGAAGGVRVDSLVSANDVTQGAGLNTRTYLDEKVQKTQLEDMRMRSRVSGLNIQNGPNGVGQTTAAALNADRVPALVNIKFLSRGVLERGEEAVLAAAVQSAVVWTRLQSPVIVAQDEGLREVRASFAAAEIVAEEDRSTPGKLRIVKLADKAAASPGDLVTFTIRYDNLGDRPVHHVRIIDNLTPRLELIEGSADSDRAGRLDTEPNGEGSLVLTFVLDEPLPGHTGGVVTFKAKVK